MSTFPGSSIRPTPGDLMEPLLSNGSAVATPASVCPPSFKRSKPRKTQDFIGSERATRDKWFSTAAEHPEEIDPRLVNDADAQQIFAKVASLVWGHIEEGNAAQAPSGPDFDEFDEVHFLRPRSRCCFPCPRRRPAEYSVSEEHVLTLLSDVAQSLYFCKQVLLLCAVYIEKLLEETCVMLTNGNWRSLVVAGLVIASKVWEDVHPWNADFEACLLDVAGMRFFPGALYKLESVFLQKLGWRVFVNGEVYASYYFALLENKSPLISPFSSSSYDGGAFRPRLSRPRLRTEPSLGSMDPILEDQMWTDPILESGEETWSSSTLLPRQSRRTSRGDSAGSCASSGLPGKDEWVADLRKSTLDGGDSQSLTSSALRDGWRLDASNPYVGAFRHAPRALAPSRYIEQSAQLMWAHELATRTAEVLGPPSCRSGGATSSVHTLSGATGSQLATELRNYLGPRAGSSASKASNDALTLSDFMAGADSSSF